jgi:PhoH-like ATPase
MEDSGDLSDVVISSVTIQELEHIKTSNSKSEDVRAKARRAVKNIRKYKVETIIYNPDWDIELLGMGLEDNNDNKIIISCSKANCDVFYTEDYLCELIASKIFNFETKRVRDDITDEYKGFIEVEDSDERTFDIYEPEDGVCKNSFNLIINQYVNVMRDGESIEAFRWNGSGYSKVPNGKIKSMYFGDIKPKDIYQKMVIDSINNNTLTCISGRAGSGKSMLSLACAMELIEKGKFDRIVILFNPCSVRGATQLGYYQGSLIEKALQSNIGNVLITKFGDRFAVENLIAQGKLKLVPMVDCRGMEIRDNEILYITEAENMTVDMMKICLSRASQFAKIIVEGDYKQIDNRIFMVDNGMSRLVEKIKGEDCFGYVQLQNVWRSKIATLMDKL